jgi:hypothetical protein
MEGLYGDLALEIRVPVEIVTTKESTIANRRRDIVNGGRPTKE